MNAPIITAIITTSGLIFVTIGKIIYNQHRTRNNLKTKAGKKLNDAFTPTNKAVIEYNGYFNHLVNILRDHSKNQRIAVHDFRLHLGCIKRYRFNKAWKNYYGNKAKILELIHYQTKDIQKILLSQIDQILKFTK